MDGKTDFVTREMELAMVDPAKRDRELVAHSTSECTRRAGSVDRCLDALETNSAILTHPCW